MKKAVFIISTLFLICHFSTYAKEGSNEKYGFPPKAVAIMDFPNNATVVDVEYDKDGYVWIATTNEGLFRYDGKTYIQFKGSDSNGDIHSHSINVLSLSADNELFIGTDNGIYKLAKEENCFVQYHLMDGSTIVQNILNNSRGDLFAVTKNGIFILDEERRNFKQVIPLEDNYISGIIIDDYDNIWVFADYHLFKYDNQSNLEKRLDCKSPLIKVIKGNGNKALVRSYPNLLVFDFDESSFGDASEEMNQLYRNTTFDYTYIGKGILFNSSSRFHIIDMETETLFNEDSPTFPFVRTDESFNSGRLFKTVSGDVWIAPEHGKPHLLNRTVEHPHISFERFVESHNTKNIVSNGRYIWLVSDGCNLTSYDTQTKNIETTPISDLVGRNVNQWRDCRLFLNTQSSTLFISIDSNIFGFSINNDGNLSIKNNFYGQHISSYMTMTVGNDGTVWAGGESNLVGYAAKSSQKFPAINLKDIKIEGIPNQAAVTSITTLRNGNIVTGFTESGIAVIDPINNTGRHINLSDGNRLSRINALCETLEGKLLIGTENNGLIVYDSSSGSTSYPEQFDGKRINNILRGDDGTIFIVCDNTALYLFLKDSAHFLYVLNGNSNPEFITSSLFRIDNREYLFLNGSLYPLKNNDNLNYSGSSIPFDILVCDTEGNVIDILSNDGKKQVWLDSKNTSISALFSFKCHEDNHYRYICKSNRHESLDSETIDDPIVQLKSMPYGITKLSFSIGDSFKDNYNTAFSAKIAIRRAWYFSIVSISIYCLVIVILLIFLLFSFKEMNRKKIEFEIARKQNEIQEMINNDNMDFFTNISHEFRTPLTIISDATDTLIKSRNINSQELRLLHAMQRNTRRMMRYVSQILEFNKAEHNKLKASVKISDVTLLINNVIEAYSNYSEQKKITLKTNLDKSILTWIDEDFFDKIMYNILSNAFKYTPIGGTIQVDVNVIGETAVKEAFHIDNTVNGTYLQVSISDTGIGIPDEKKKLIFERFSKAESSKIAEGTGIGMFFTKSLVEAHHGMIKLEDNVTGGLKQGSVFSFVIPMDSNAYSKEEIMTKQRDESMDSKKYLEEMPTLSISPTEESEMQKVLVIDDDSEIIYYLKLILSPYYQVITSMDAMTGYKLIETEQPDLIVSDVMMLEIDGIKLCKMVKENINICNIPFILLTAKTTKHDQIEGLNAGAEAYIAKPFDSEYLISVIRSILTNRSNVQKLLGENTSVVEKIKDTAVSEKDKNFMEKLYQYMADNIMDTELNVDEFAASMQMSRTKFFYKIKSLTGQTPNEFFKKYKLNRAVELIRENKYKLSAISDMVGFSSPSHFANTFKKYFGVLPSKF